MYCRRLRCGIDRDGVSSTGYLDMLPLEHRPATTLFLKMKGDVNGLDYHPSPQIVAGEKLGRSCEIGIHTVIQKETKTAQPCRDTNTILPVHNSQMKLDP